MDNATRQTYYETVDGVTYRYMESGGSWDRREFGGSMDYFDKSEFTRLAGCFESMTYQDGAYVGGNLSMADGTISYLKVKFSDGRPVEIRYQEDSTFSGTPVNIDRDLRLSGFGSTSVTLPEATGDTGEYRVTAEQWEAALTLEGIESGSFRMTYLSDGDYADYRFDFSDPQQKKAWQQNSNAEAGEPAQSYYVQYAGETVYTAYQQIHGEWVPYDGDTSLEEWVLSSMIGGFDLADLETKQPEATLITGNMGKHYYQLKGIRYSFFGGPASADLELEFDEHRLVRFKFESSIDFEITFSDYDATSITLPDFGA